MATIAVSHRVSDSCTETLSQRVAILHLVVIKHGASECKVNHGVDVDNKHCKRYYHLTEGWNNYLIN